MFWRVERDMTLPKILWTTLKVKHLVCHAKVFCFPTPEPTILYCDPTESCHKNPHREGGRGMHFLTKPKSQSVWDISRLALRRMIFFCLFYTQIIWGNFFFLENMKNSTAEIIQYYKNLGFSFPISILFGVIFHKKDWRTRHDPLNQDLTVQTNLTIMAKGFLRQNRAQVT